MIVFKWIALAIFFGITFAGFEFNNGSLRAKKQDNGEDYETGANGSKFRSRRSWKW